MSRELRVGEILNMKDGGPCEVVAVPERGLALLEPIVKQKNVNLEIHGIMKERKVIVVRKKAKINIEPGQYVDFYI